MRGINCIHCFSDDVEFKADILVGCCQHKSGEVWQCNTCGKEMIIETVYTDDIVTTECPHKAQDAGTGHSAHDGCSGGHGCEGCENCDKKTNFV